MRVRTLALGLLLAVIVSFSSCKSKPEAADQHPEKTLASAFKPNPAADAQLSGVIKFTGAVPRPIPIDMSADPACKGQNVAQPIAAKNGNLANVFVYVKDGLPKNLVYTWLFAPVEITQQGCKYVPHVVGIMAGQTIRIINADDTMHNIHPMPQHNHEWNAAQMSHGEPLVKKFDNPELMIPVKCNQHPWMKMYVNVADSPFFAVSDENGSFKIAGLPPGTYTIAAIHETLGEQTHQLTIGPKEAKSLSFAFSAQNSAAAAK